MGREQKDLSEASASMDQSQRPGHPPRDRSAGTDGAAGTQPSEQGFDQALRSALAENKIADARTLVANAEAVMHGDATSEQEWMGAVGIADLAVAKARIAMATDDRGAARAILVNAIEANPKSAVLKALMTEVMMADGRATDVRPVLQHLGNDLKGGIVPGTAADTTGPKVRDTSG